MHSPYSLSMAFLSFSFFLLTDVFTPQMTSCSWRSMRASSQLPFRHSSLGEQPRFKRKWIILWNEWRHVPESQLAQNSLPFLLPCTAALSVSPSLLLSFSVFRIFLQLENSKRRKEILQDNAVAPPYVSCHDFLARVEGFPVHSERDVLKTQHNPFCYKECLFFCCFFTFFPTFDLCLHSLFTLSSSLYHASSQKYLFVEGFKAWMSAQAHQCAPLLEGLFKYCPSTLCSLMVFELPVLRSLEMHWNGWYSLGISAPFYVHFVGWACNSYRVDSVDLAYLGKGQDCWSMCHCHIDPGLAFSFKHQFWSEEVVQKWAQIQDPGIVENQVLFLF